MGKGRSLKVWGGKPSSLFGLISLVSCFFDGLVNTSFWRVRRIWQDRLSVQYCIIYGAIQQSS